MNSIPKTATFGLTKNGLIVTGQEDRRGFGRIDAISPIRTAGDIKGFSKTSRLRFRRLLAVSDSINKDFEPWGVCLTIPGRVISQERARKIWRDWGKSFCVKRFKDFPMIWRVELQTRKQAHWHLIIWLPKGRKGIEPRVDYSDCWKSFIRRTLAKNGVIQWSEETDAGFEKRGVKFQRLGTLGKGSSDYLASTLDHETKHKQEQLGWRGRQWGIINRDRLSKSPVDSVSVWGHPVERIVRRFKAVQEHRRASGRGYVGAGVGEHWRLPSVLYGKDAEILTDIVKSELDLIDQHQGKGRSVS